MPIKSSFNKLGLLAYISAAKIVISCTDSKFALLELLIKKLRVNASNPLKAWKPHQGLIKHHLKYL